MIPAASANSQPLVALLAEGVDRNRLHYICTMEDETSPSSRRAWIEISLRQ